MGPMTGRAAGYCAGYPVPGYMNPVGGRGGAWGGGGAWGWGGRGGRGRRNWFHATGMPGWQRAAMGWPAYGGWGPPVAPRPWTAPPPVAPAVPPFAASPYGPVATKEQELEALKGQSEYLEDALDGIRKRIGELEATTQED